MYALVLLAIAIGILLGHFYPELGVHLKILGDVFIGLIKMLIAPVVFCTIALGISGAGDMKKVGRIGVTALIYFEIVSTFALLIGLFVGNWIKPGAGFNVDPASLKAESVLEFSTKAHEAGIMKFVLNLIPKTFVDSFTGGGDLLQVLLIAVLFGYALNRLGEKGKTVHHLLDSISKVFFIMVDLVMKLAPLGALGAMAFTVGKYGLESLSSLFALVLCFYVTCFFFIFVVLGVIARLTGFSILKFLKYIGSELLTVLGTSSSESALVPLMDKLEKLGVSRTVVGLVVPSGYSFNLDGTNIYLTLAVLFVAQALNIDLSLYQQASILVIAMISSKGASGVTGAGFITLAATLAVVPEVPVAGLALILGVDRFMSEARALTNIIGNGVATLVVAKREKELDLEALNKIC